mmetsp:Transcript_408/g.1023  ORF Transcript_408/g.1023 Transcript_408/m.1023 type:complete len:630 (-) Transcript_408:1333-3222(-)
MIQPATTTNRKVKRSKVSNRARHRLKSIRYDVEHVVQPTLKMLVEFQQTNNDGPSCGSSGEHDTSQNVARPALFCNERCGAWYFKSTGNGGGEDTSPTCVDDAADKTTENRSSNATSSLHSCYFKSTDGHPPTWWFSLKRLNLNVIYKAIEHDGCIILDASVAKEMPDSFSRTIPIWCAVLNRIVDRYRQELQPDRCGEGTEQGEGTGRNSDFSSLYTPRWLVDADEHEKIDGLLDERVDELYQSRAIVNPKKLVSMLDKPLRPYWVTPEHSEIPSSQEEWDKSYPIICLNCSKQHPTEKRVWMEEEQFWYTPGSADDEESWARHLNPTMFWKHIDRLKLDEDTVSEDDTDQIIDTIINEERLKENLEPSLNQNSNQSLYDEIGSTGLYIGSRRSSRPPECWNSFDAILNVTNTEYEDMTKITMTHSSHSSPSSTQCRYYLQLPVQEGKRDKKELERWLPIGILFVVYHAQHNRRVLIHCAQGKDRSVAVAIAVVLLFCVPEFPLRWNDELFRRCRIHDVLLATKGDERDEDYFSGRDLLTGLPVSIESMLGESGRNWLFQVIHDYKEQVGEAPATTTPTKAILPPLANKESIRIAFHLIRQDREQAEPTRSTFQKLNRFFMSGSGCRR